MRKYGGTALEHGQGIEHFARLQHLGDHSSLGNRLKVGEDGRGDGGGDMRMREWG